MKISKHFMLAGFLLSACALTLPSCDDDNAWPEVDGLAPSVSLNGVEVHIEAGMNISIKGKLTDADGITTIHLESPGLYLDKTIDLVELYGEPLKEYDLDYNAQSLNHLEGEEFIITITVTDAGGRQTTEKYTVALDGDFTAPWFSIKPDENLTILIKDKTLLKLNFEVEDNAVIDYATIDLKKVDGSTETSMPGYPQTIQGDGAKLTFNEAIEVPSEAAVYKAYITAYDIDKGDGVHTVSTESTITVQDLPDFPVIYLADVDNEADLNADVFGVPIAMDHIGAYKYRVHYYNATAGTKVCFIPQKGSFGPICFAPSKDNAAVLGDDLEQENKLVLDKAGVYYEITVDTWNRSYETTTYAISEAVSPITHMQYGGDMLNTWVDWNTTDPWWQKFYFGPASGPKDVLEMEQSKTNPNIFTLEWNLKADTFDDNGDLKFIIHNWHHDGWWNYATWRVDDSADPSKCMWYGLYFPNNILFTGNADWFQWKYINIPESEYKYMYPDAPYPFNMETWGSEEGYRKNFVPDNWVKVNHPSAGTYIVTLDVHAERIKMVRK